jgi:hypothetical protein
VSKHFYLTSEAKKWKVSTQEVDEGQKFEANTG